MNIAKSIGELLFENKAVVVPGLGGFTTAHKSASIDFVQGSIAPPSKNISFNENLKLNDGVLVNHLQKEYEVSVEDAQKSIDEFVENVKSTLGKKEIVELPKVGRIYLDYENKMKFLPEGTNFNTDAFGLPTVTSKPIIRKTPVSQTVGIGVTDAKSTIASNINTPPPSYSQSDFKQNWASNLLWLALLLAVIVMFFSIYFIMKSPSPAETEVADQPINEERLNKSPSGLDGEEALLDDQEDLEDFAMDEMNEEENLSDLDNLDDENIDSPNEPEEEIDTETETIPPRSKEAFIVIHSLTKKAGAENFLKKLNKDGFNGASVHQGRFYRVGVEFFYQEEQELEELITDIKEKYKTDVVIWEGGKGKAN